MWSQCEQIIPVHFIPYQGHSLVGWILGAIFCVNMLIFFFNKTKRLNFNISHYTRLSTEIEHVQWTILFSFSLSVCLSLTLPPIFPLFLSFVTLCSQFSRPFILLAKTGKEHCSNQVCWTQIRTALLKIFHWLVTIWTKSKAIFFLTNYKLDHKPYCVWIISLITVKDFFIFLILLFPLWECSSTSLILISLS